MLGSELREIALTISRHSDTLRRVCKLLDYVLLASSLNLAPHTLQTNISIFHLACIQRGPQRRNQARHRIGPRLLEARAKHDSRPSLLQVKNEKTGLVDSPHDKPSMSRYGPIEHHYRRKLSFLGSEVKDQSEDHDHGWTPDELTPSTVLVQIILNLFVSLLTKSRALLKIPTDFSTRL